MKVDAAGWFPILVSGNHGALTGTSRARRRDQAQFAPTRWSVVLAAQDSGSPSAEAALARLCEVYWYPIYAFLRRKGHSSYEAEDLVTLLHQSLDRLRKEDAATGRAARFDALVPYLSKETAPDRFARLANELGISEQAARQEVGRLCKRYREAVRKEIGETV